MITGKCVMRQIVLLALAFCVGAFFAYANEYNAIFNGTAAPSSLGGQTVALPIFLLANNSIILLIGQVFAYIILNKICKEKKKRLFLLSSIAGVVLGACYMLGYNLQQLGTIFSSEINIVLEFIFFTRFIGSCILYFCATYFLFECVDVLRNKKITISDRICRIFKFSFAKYFIVLLIVKIPFVILFYPGICSEDSMGQIVQGLGLFHWTNHHPVMMTLFLSWMTKIGTTLFGSVGIGVFLYTTIQMVAISVIATLILQYLYKKRINSVIFILITLYFIFNPLFWIYSITVWKDVWLAHSVLVYSILLYELCARNVWSRKLIFLFCISCLAVIFSKNTGIVIFLLSFPLIFFVNHSFKRNVLTLLGICIVAYTIKTSIFAIYDVQAGSKQEALSLFVQPIAEVVAEKSEKMDKRDLLMVQNLIEIPVDSMKDKYIRGFADPIKGKINLEVLKKDKCAYLALYLRLGVKYPQTFLNGFLGGNVGYWYPFSPHGAIGHDTYYTTGTSVTTQLNAVDTIRPLHRFDNLLARNLVRYAFYAVQLSPVLSLLLSIGFAYWIFFLCGLFFIYKKRYKLLMLMLPNFVVWLTCLASPVSNEFRYAFPVFLILPVLIGFIFKTKTNENNSNSDSMLQRK